MNGSSDQGSLRNRANFLILRLKSRHTLNLIFPKQHLQGSLLIQLEKIKMKWQRVQTVAALLVERCFHAIFND